MGTTTRVATRGFNGWYGPMDPGRKVRYSSLPFSNTTLSVPNYNRHTDAPILTGKWLRETIDDQMNYVPRTYVDVLGERFLGRLHQKCGIVQTHRFRYGDITTQTWNNSLYDGGPGLMQFSTLKPTNPHCVEGTVWELSREREGVVNNNLGLICHKTDRIEPDNPEKMFNVAMGLAEGDGCALEVVGKQCCELSYKECQNIIN